MTKFEIVENRIEEVQQDYGNISPKELEIKYGASYSTIQRVLKKYGHIKGKPEQIKYKFIREHESEFIKDWTDGILTPAELEEKYKCPYTNLYSRSIELNIYRKTFEETDECKEMINAWLTHSFSNKEICEKYNICESTLHYILRNNNINTEENKWFGRKFFFDG